MELHSLSVARENMANALAILEDAVSYLQTAGADHLATELANTVSVLHVDHQLVNAQWRELRATITMNAGV